MGRKVICLYCGENFDRDLESFIQVGNRYAHEKCFEYGDKIHKLMKDLLQKNYGPVKINRQLASFHKDGYSLQDIYETLVYWYKIKKGDVSKANGGVGIFPYIYPDYIQYKEQQEKIAQTNRGKKVSDYVNKDGQHIEAKIDPSWKIRGVKFFNL